MPPKYNRKSSFNSRKGILVGPPRKRRRFRVRYDLSVSKNDKPKQLTKTVSMFTVGNKMKQMEGAIIICAKDANDFKEQIVKGVFKYTRMKTIKKEVEGNCPIYIYSPMDKEIAGPYSMEIPRENEWNNKLVIDLENRCIVMHDIIRHISLDMDRERRQSYDSRPRIATLDKHGTLVEFLEKNILMGRSNIVDKNGQVKSSSSSSSSKLSHLSDYNCLHEIKRKLNKGGILGTEPMYRDNSNYVFEDPLYVEYFRFHHVQNRNIESLFIQLKSVCAKYEIPHNIAEIAKAFNQWVFAVETPKNYDDPIIPCFPPVTPKGYINESICSMIKTVLRLPNKEKV